MGFVSISKGIFLDKEISVTSLYCKNGYSSTDGSKVFNSLGLKLIIGFEISAVFFCDSVVLKFALFVE